MNDKLTIKRAASTSKYKPKTIHKAVLAGKIKCVKIGNQWFLDRQSFLDWANDPEQHRVGRPPGKQCDWFNRAAEVARGCRRAATHKLIVEVLNTGETQSLLRCNAHTNVLRATLEESKVLRLVSFEEL